jgi:signal transduction histidine kinase
MAITPDERWLEPGDGSEPDADIERVRRRLLRLAFDIHDGPLQSLAAAGFGLSGLQERLEKLTCEAEERAAAQTLLAEIVAELSEGERSLRQLVSMLEDSRPEIPLAKDILEAELERFRRRSGAEVAVEGEWIFHPDSRSQALTLEALVRESLANVAKHAHARHVILRLQRSRTHLLLEIQDDGRGFERSRTDPGAIGLRSMRERVRLLGGELEILSRPGGPTVVSAVLRRWRRPSSAVEYTAPRIASPVA